MSVAAFTDTQRRFLAAVAQRLPHERLRELYLFAPIKQGGVETGIAVVAVGAQAVGPDDPTTDDGPADALLPVDASTTVEPSPGLEVTATDDGAVAPLSPVARFTIFTARYRLQLKGPERGTWEVDVVEEADAPLVTVDAVVRGVQRRASDLTDVERLSPDDLAHLLDDGPWLTRT